MARAVARAEGPLKRRISALETTLAEARDQALLLARTLSTGDAGAAPGSPPPPPGEPGTAETEESRAPAAVPGVPDEPDDRDFLGEVPNGRGGAPGAPDDPLPEPQRRILSALDDLSRLGLAAVDRGTLAVYAHQSPRSSAYRDHVADLKRRGLVDYPGDGRVALAEQGRRRARSRPGRPGRPRTLAGLHQAWLGYLPHPQGRLLELLLERYPKDLSREELAGLAGRSPTSSAYRDQVAALRNLGLVEYPRPGRVRAGALLFPGGLS